jgi:hypothetical protein
MMLVNPMPGGKAFRLAALMKSRRGNIGLPGAAVKSGQQSRQQI